MKHTLICGYKRIFSVFSGRCFGVIESCADMKKKKARERINSFVRYIVQNLFFHTPYIYFYYRKNRCMGDILRGGAVLVMVCVWITQKKKASMCVRPYPSLMSKTIRNDAATYTNAFGVIFSLNKTIANAEAKNV